MSLAGNYVINNKVRDRPVGLGPVDPGTSLPVLTFPKDSPNTTGPRVFHIVPIADDRYRLKFIQGPQRAVGMKSDKDLVWAFGPHVQPPSDEWKITHVPQHGKDAYLIETPDKNDGKGWVASEDDDTQIAVKPLIAFMTFPPTYPPTEIFELVALIESDESTQA